MNTPSPSDIANYRKQFEYWVSAAFGKDILSNCQFDDENGYDDNQINCMWVGYCAALILATTSTRR